MTRQVITRRQKDVSRLLREKRQAYPDKLKAGGKRNSLWKAEK